MGPPHLARVFPPRSLALAPVSAPRKSPVPLTHALTRALALARSHRPPSPSLASSPPRPTMSSASKRDAFLAVWPSLATELVDYLRAEGMPQDAVSWFQRVSSRVPPLPLEPTKGNG